MIGIILLIIFFWGLAFFGWQVVRFVLKTSRIELLIPLSLVIGYGVYTFFLNIFSYLIPIELNFYIIFAFLLMVGFCLFLWGKQSSSFRCELNKKEGLIIFSTVFIIMILSGLLVSRFISSDDLAYPHLPTAASIAGGNFPVKNLNLPDYDLVMHYGPNLFFAAISKISNFSVFFSFRLCVFLFSGVIFLLIFNLAKLFIKNNIGSFLVALVGMFGGGFRFIYGCRGLTDLFRKFFLHKEIEHPFKFFGYMWKAQPLTSSLVGDFSITTWAVLSWSLVLVIIYLYLRKINDKKWSYSCDFLLIILLSILALTFELAFLAICFGIFVVPFIFYFKDKDKDSFKLLMKHSLLILIPTAILVLFQGGTITGILKNIIVQRRASYGVGLDFSISKNPLSFDTDNLGPLSIFGSTFILSFGLVYFLVVPAIIFMARRYFRKSIFLIVISCFSFFIPLFVSFAPLWQAVLDRFFRFCDLIWAILVGLFLMTILLQLKRGSFFKKIIYVCLIIICLEGVLLLLTRPLYKKNEPRLDNKGFLAKLVPLTEVESIAYKWVRENSGLKDYFLVFADLNHVNDTVFENFRFVLFTRRLAPIYTQSNNYVDHKLPPDDFYTPIYKRLISDCHKNDMETLGYKYLFINNNWPSNLEERCLLENNLELKYEARNNNEFARIYLVK